MEFMTGKKEKEVLDLAAVFADGMEGREVKVNGAIMSVRNMGDIAFVILRKRDGVLQTVYEKGVTDADFAELREETFVEVSGVLRKEERAPRGMELRLKSVRILSKPEEPMPIAVSKWKMSASLEAKLDMRSLTLRNLRERARFRIQEGIARAFREYLHGEGFTEIHSPKIGAKGAEGGANVFKLDYFHRPAVLAQSPQFYKQMMVGVFDRVMEVGPVFRAEKHNTKRHLNEYTGLDFEMGYIDDFTDIMAMETGFLQYAVELLLFIGGFHFSDLVYVVGFDNLHHLIWCTLCAEYRSALSEYAGKILRLHYTAVIMDQTVETVGYADYFNVVLAEHGVTGFCRTSYSSVKSGAVASARQYTDSALCHLYIQPFLKDLLFSAN